MKITEYRRWTYVLKYQPAFSLPIPGGGFRVGTYNKTHINFDSDYKEIAVYKGHIDEYYLLEQHPDLTQIDYCNHWKIVGRMYYTKMGTWDREII